jgi:hypothetical protein
VKARRCGTSCLRLVFLAGAALSSSRLRPRTPRDPLTRPVPLRRAPKRAASLALALAMVLAVPGGAWAQGDPYKLHMDNGVKLFSDKNYPAAVAEFQAAYEARPGANPLVNIALCDKEMFRYPQAIAALQEAIEKHGSSMDQGDLKAAVDAIKEMRALLGTVTLTVTPRGAAVSVDGEDLPAGAADKPLLLGPGTHKIAARAPGYSPAEQRVMVASERAQTVSLALVEETGQVTIEAPDPATQITLDGVPRAAGSWTGMLPAGLHLVTLTGADGRPYGEQIQVVAGVHQVVKPTAPQAPPSPHKEDPQRRGFYVLGLGSMLVAVTHPPQFGPVNVPDYGAGYGLRAGFQVNRVAGFDLTYEHSSITSYTAGTQPTSTAPNNYRLIADRLVVGLRIISTGSVLRFVGNFGGGFVNDQMAVNLYTKPGACTSVDSQGKCFLQGNHVGVDAFVLAEAGLEVDVDRVLLDFCTEGQLQSTGNLQGANNLSIFGSLPLLNAGAAVRIGYRFW